VRAVSGIAHVLRVRLVSHAAYNSSFILTRHSTMLRPCQSLQFALHCLSVSISGRVIVLQAPQHKGPTRQWDGRTFSAPNLWPRSIPSCRSPRLQGVCTAAYRACK